MLSLGTGSRFQFRPEGSAAKETWRAALPLIERLRSSRQLLKTFSFCSASLTHAFVVDVNCSPEGIIACLLCANFDLLWSMFRFSHTLKRHVRDSCKLLASQTVTCSICWLHVIACCFKKRTKRREHMSSIMWQFVQKTVSHGCARRWNEDSHRCNLEAIPKVWMPCGLTRKSAWWCRI